MNQPFDHLNEVSREIPVGGRSYDVIVAGGGPAGIAAALTASRSGARTALIETHGQLGGVWTSGALSWIIDAANKGGIMRELMTALDARGARTGTGEADFAYDVEVMKLVLEEKLSEAGVDVRLHTRVVAANLDSPRRLNGLITESKSGREGWVGRNFVDATGDGDLAAQAGCGFDLGRPENGECQPMSLMAILTGLRGSEVEDFLVNGPGGHSRAWRRLREAVEAGGHSPSYGSPALFRIHENLFALMANHEYGASALDAGEITRATLSARRDVFAAVAALKKNGGVWEEVRIAATGAQIGVREGRRIHGLYRVSVDDLLNGTRHADAICTARFAIDVHSPDPAKSKDFSSENRAVKPYDIPLRAIIARDVDNVLLAGRCISGEFLAHSSYRVTGNAVALGEGAGLAAARSAASGILPKDLDGKRIASELALLRIQVKT